LTAFGLAAMAFAPEGSRAAGSYLFNGGISAMAVTPEGVLTPAGAQTVTPSATGLAVSPDGRFAYIPTRDFGGTMAVGIMGFAFGADGSLTQLPTSPYSSGEIGDIAMTADGRFLYAQIGNAVRGFAVGADGSLTPLGDTPVAGSRYVTTSPDARFLFVGYEANPSDGVRSFAIGAGGALTEVGSPAETGAQGLELFAVSPDGSHLYIPDSNADRVHTAAVGADGSLSVVDSLTAPDVESVAVSPDERFLYMSDTLQIFSAAIGADAKPVLTGKSVPFATGEAARMVFQPQPAPQAKFEAKPAPPKAQTRFDAGLSARAATYAWDFGDGTVLPDGGANPAHAYAKPGVYDVTLKVTDDRGCSSAQVYTGQSTDCPGGSAAIATKRVDTPPVLSKLKAKPRSFNFGDRTKFTFKLSEKAKVTLKIERKQGKRFVAVGKLKAKGKEGKNRKGFSGVLRGKSLEPGAYRVSAVAKDSAGGKSKRKRAPFKIAR
jgi:6-phosphogluconolactonase (cycloisomerase 2 family)